jgi:hypothetical protein
VRGSQNPQPPQEPKERENSHLLEQAKDCGGKERRRVQGGETIKIKIKEKERGGVLSKPI